MDLSSFLDSTLKKATVPGQKVFARDLYDQYAAKRLTIDSPVPTPTFLHFVGDLKDMGYRVARNTAKQRHGQTIICDIVLK